MMHAITVRPSRSDFLILAAVLATLFASLMLRSAFPMGDPAIFEYIGHALVGGAHLYSDLWDNKLPSIYYINALWWLAFGANFPLHVAAETAINAVTFGTFALILRRCGIERWALGALVFALFYLFVGGPLDQTEHYATPLILAALLAALHRSPVLAGILLVFASTFWVPSIAIGLVPLLCIGDRRARVSIVCAAIGGAVLCAAIFWMCYGPATTSELIHSWISYQSGNFNAAGGVEPHRYALPFFSPRYYIESGLGLLVAGIAVFWTKDRLPASRFAWSWAIATTVIVFALGRPSIHYFLPLYAPLAMLLVMQPLRPSRIRQRWYFSAVAVACGAAMMALFVRDVHRPFFGSEASIEYTGTVVRDAFGPHVVALLPWEIFLSSDAVPPSRFFLARGNVKFARDRDRWNRRPLVFVDAGDLRFNGIRPPKDLRFSCQSRLTYPYVIHADRVVSGLACEHG